MALVGLGHQGTLLSVDARRRRADWAQSATLAGLDQPIL
jgi:hypothetical protein